MVNNIYISKHLRGSSPHKEMKNKAYNNMRNSRSIGHDPEDPPTVLDRVELLENQTMNLVTPQADRTPQANDGKTKPTEAVTKRFL